MANEVRMTSVGELGADDDADFAIKVVDQDGAEVVTALSVDAQTGAVSVGVSIDGTTAQTVTPDSADGEDNMIVPGTSLVEVGANVNDVNDWITLPAIADVPVGFAITVVSNAAGHGGWLPAGGEFPRPRRPRPTAHGLF